MPEQIECMVILDAYREQFNLPNLWPADCILDHRLLRRQGQAYEEMERGEIYE